MAADQRSPREIERELEREREDLRRNVDEVMNRLTFDDAWNRAGRYMRENRSDLGGSLMTVIKEKPAAIGLIAIGLAWLMFGPVQSAAPRDGRGTTRVPEPYPYGRRDEEVYGDDRLSGGLATAGPHVPTDYTEPVNIANRSLTDKDDDLSERRTSLETQPDPDPLKPTGTGTTENADEPTSDVGTSVDSPTTRPT